MPLTLKRPLIVLDLETTGTNPRLDRIVEVGAVKLHPDGRRELWKRRLNPQRPIPPGATAVHGIRDEDVATAPTFAEIAFDLCRFLGGADFAGFGIIKFDLPLLAEEFRRVSIAFPPPDAKLVDAQRIYHMREPRTLSAALRFYCDREHVGAHGAEADVLATIDVLEGQLRRYPDLPASVDDLDRLCQQRRDGAIDPGGRLRWSGGEVVLGFGPKAGMSLRELVARDASFLRWILNKDFPAEVKTIVREALEGRFPAPPGEAPANGNGTGNGGADPETQEELPL